MITINLGDPQFWIGAACAILGLIVIAAIFAAMEDL